MSEFIKQHNFKIGKAYESVKDVLPQDYLHVALQAERFIAQSQHETEDGIYWQKAGTATLDQTFYSGSAGILYYYLKLFETFGDEKYREIAEKGTRYLVLHWKDFLNAAPTVPLPGAHEGFYFGLGGLAVVLDEAWQALQDETAAEAARQIGTYYGTTAKTDAEGAYWSNGTGMAMDGGIILVLLQQYRLFKDEDTRKLILGAAKRYLKKGKRRTGGGLEYNGFEGVLPISLPNFEFGTAGSGYLLTQLYEFTGDKAYLEAAKACTVYLDEIGVKQEKGCLIPHHVYGPADEKPIFYLGSCHGPAGTAKLYYQLYKLTGEVHWMESVGALVDGLESVGAPEKQSTGLWNNVCLCCGHAGLVQFFIGLYQGTGNVRWKNLARRSAAVLLGEKEELEDGAANWPLAWERIKPEEISTPIGYYDGAAGISAALLQIYLSENGSFHWSRLPDDPFPVES